MTRISKAMKQQHEEMLRLQSLNQISGDDALRLLQGGYVDLSEKTIMGDVIVRNMGIVFEEVVNLSGSVIYGSLKFLGNSPSLNEDDENYGAVKMSIKGLLISGARVVGEVDLSQIILEDVADLEDAIIGRDLNLNRTHVRKHLNVERTQIHGDALFNGAVVHCGMCASDIVCWGKLDLRGAVVRQNLNIQRAVIKGDASLISVSIGGRIFSVAARFGGDVNLSCAVVSDVLDLGGASINHNLDLRGALLSGLNLTGLKDVEGIVVDEKMAQLVHFSAPNIPLMVETNENIHF